MSEPTLSSRFDPRVIEPRWQDFWADHQYFRAPETPRRPTFVVPHPPPNVTGALTLGHALGDTVRDVFVRWHRMRGFDTLWFPGVDHAGLATQIEVRRRLAQEGVALESLSRQEVLARVEAWKADHERRIQEQTRAGGFSMDWTRYRYTMDPGNVRATRTAFVRLFDAGLIYRGERFVNWDPELRTAISDLEVSHAEEAGELLYVRFPWADGAPGGVVVATVRPETIFGDVAVAVHPADDRHRGSVGRSVRIPLTDRVVPVVADELIDRGFGTGALKVTPRHDPFDYLIRERNPELPLPASILDERACLEGPLVPAEFRGLDRDTARAQVTESLAREGYIERRETIQHAVARSERSDAVVEPRLSRQWFVKVGPLAEPVVAAVRSGSVRIHPERWTLTFFRWLETLEDWCISRQIIWGHPIPVYTCRSCGLVVARVDPPSACDRCHSSDLEPDPDVLDTWFTSWLWPFAALGWPEETGDLHGYYPSSLLVTGRDIMFFWVARMLFAGFYFTGQAPFADVFFTGMLRDERGQRYSKHLGNSPDPAVLVRESGADALRVGLLYPNPVDQDTPFGPASVDQARHFLTKVWNLVRFAQPHFAPGMAPARAAPLIEPDTPLEDRWVLARWTTTAEAMDRALDAFEPTSALSLLHGFLWHDLADRYVEVAKEALSGRAGDAAMRRTREVLLYLLDRSLRQLHPFAPHVTEELWHALPHEGDALAVGSWPPSEPTLQDPEAELAMEKVWETIRGFRGLKTEQRIPASTMPRAWFVPATAETARLMTDHRATICRLARLQGLDVSAVGGSRPPGAAGTVTPAGELFVELAGAVPEDRAALARERVKLEALLERTRSRLADDRFRSQAPPEVLQDAEAKASDLAERIQKLDAHLQAPEAPEGVP